MSSNKGAPQLSALNKLIIGTVFGVIGVIVVTIVILAALGYFSGDSSSSKTGGETVPREIPSSNPFCCKGFVNNQASYWWDCLDVCHSLDADLVQNISTEVCLEREQTYDLSLPTLCEEYIVQPPEGDPYLQVSGVGNFKSEFAFLDGIYEICTFAKCPELAASGTNVVEGYNGWLVHLDGDPTVYGNVYKKLDPGYERNPYITRFTNLQREWWFVEEQFCSNEINCNYGYTRVDGFFIVDGDNCPECSLTLHNGAIGGIIQAP
jgi:hypothetical protein